jgi:o-succinylbenzoate synthase
VTVAPYLSCRRQEFTLDPPLVTARGQWQSRQTLLVRLHGGDGCDGQGEAAPLPGYSPDGLPAVERGLLALSSGELVPALAGTTAAGISRAVAALLPAELPSARFALETALLDRLGRRLGRPLWSLLREAQVGGTQELARAVPLCSLLPSDDPAGALAQALRLSELGVQAFKLKIGPDVVQPAQLELLASLRDALGERVELRLDANRSLSGRTLRAVLDGLLVHRPEFVEEPVAQPEPDQLRELACGWALDESLQGMHAATLEGLCRLPSCRALVLKPTALGGLGRCSALAAVARAHGKALVVSHTLEGPIGWLACVHLALALGPAAAAGLWPLPHQSSAAGRIVGGQLQLPLGPGLGVEP